jgi:hypothetical protein
MTFPNPVTFPIARGKPLLVMSCSATKRPAGANEWLRFADLYIGPMWQQVHASKYPLTNVAAVSALYGFLEPGMPINTYDRVMDEKIAHSICHTSNHVARFHDATMIAGSAFVVGGQLYQELAKTAIRWRPALGELVTFASGSFLQQRKQLGQWLREAA